MKRIAIDMDEVITDLLVKHVAVFNEAYNEQITLEDLQGKKLGDLHPHLTNEISEFLTDPAFFRDLKVMKDSQEVIKELHEHYEIFIVTAAMDFPTSFASKYDWLTEHFGFLSGKNFVFCGDKSIIHADYLIDDTVRHLNGFSGQGILFTAPHNIHETGFPRVNSWQEVRNYFLT